MSCPTPCLGCGWCCLRDQCELSQRLHGYQKRCPSLCWDDGVGRYYCALMRDPATVEMCRREVFIGQGCCWPGNPLRDELVRRRRRSRPEGSGPEET